MTFNVMSSCYYVVRTRVRAHSSSGQFEGKSKMENGRTKLIVLGRQLSTLVLYLISSSGNTTFTVAGSCKDKAQQIPKKNVETVSTEQVGVVAQQQGVYMIVY